MRVLHTSFMLNPIHGILNQMCWEQIAAHKNKLDWTTRLFCPAAAALSPSEILVRAKTVSASTPQGLHRRAENWVKLRREYYNWLETQAARYDVILLRHSLYDPLQAAFIQHLKTPFYLVHHTLEIPEIKYSNRVLTRSIQAKLENAFGRQSLMSARGLIGVTDEIVRYEKSRIKDQGKASYVYANGIHYPADTDEKSVDQRGTIPEILFVASHFASWHGLDLLLESLKRSDSTFILHLVGGLSPRDQSIASRDHRVQQHGMLHSADIDELSQKCWLGLSSFALHRKSMAQACTLKVREYLKNGLPVYANYQDVFPDTFGFYKKGPPEIEAILDYARSVRGATRLEVARQAQPFISKDALILALYDWLKNAHS